LRTLKEILSTIPDDLPVLLDAKRGDIGNTAEAYAKAVFEYWAADAVTVNPYLGEDGIAPFLEYSGKMVFVLCKTSNPSAEEIQDHGNPELYKQIARAATTWGREDQIGLVVGATKLEALDAVRGIAPQNWILSPGVGAQGGDLRRALEAGLRKDLSGMIIPVSRSIIFADDPLKAADDLRKRINQVRNGIKEQARKNLPVSKKIFIDGLFDAECVKFGNFTLASGKNSPIYIDLRKIISYPDLFARCIEVYKQMAETLKYELIAAVPYAALPMAAGVAQQLHVPMVYPRKEAKAHGSGQMVEGAYRQGETALLIEDVITTGGSILTAVQTLKDSGIIVKDVLVLVDREQGGSQTLREASMTLHAYLRLIDIVETLHQEGKTR